MNDTHPQSATSGPVGHSQSALGRGENLTDPRPDLQSARTALPHSRSAYFLATQPQNENPNPNVYQIKGPCCITLHHPGPHRCIRRRNA